MKGKSSKPKGDKVKLTGASNKDTGARSAARKRRKDEERFDSTYNEVLGRDPTDQERREMSSVPSSQLQRHLAVSDEARKRGVDPSKYGVTPVSVDSLGKRDREFYDIWRKYNPNAEFNTAVHDTLRWESGRGNAKVYEARQVGLINDTLQHDEESGTVTRFTHVSPHAEQWAEGAGNLTFYGHARNQVIMGPAGMDLKFYKRNRDAEEKWELPDGTTVFGATGKPRKALLQKVGIGEFIESVVPNQLQFVSDIFTPVGSFLIDQDWSEKGVKSMSNTFGGDVSDWQTAQSIASSVTDTAAMIATGGAATPLIIAKNFASAANQAYAYNTSLSDGFKMAAAKSVGTLVTAGFSGGEGIAGAFQNAGAASLGSLSSGALTPSKFQSDSIWKDAAWAGVGSLIASGATSALGETPWAGDLLKSSKLAEGFAAAATGYGVSYGLGKARYGMDSGYQEALDRNADRGMSVSRQLNMGALSGAANTLASSAFGGSSPLENKFGSVGKFGVPPAFSNERVISNADGTKSTQPFWVNPFGKESRTTVRDFALRPSVLRFGGRFNPAQRVADTFSSAGSWTLNQFRGTQAK